MSLVGGGLVALALEYVSQVSTTLKMKERERGREGELDGDRGEFGLSSSLSIEESRDSFVTHQQDGADEVLEQSSKQEEKKRTFAHMISILRMPYALSSCVAMAPGRPSKKAGQPQPESNLVSDLYSGVLQPAQL